MNVRNSRNADALYDPAAAAQRGRRLAKPELSAAIAEALDADVDGDICSPEVAAREAARQARPATHPEAAFEESTALLGELARSAAREAIRASTPAANTDDEGELPERWDGLS